MSSAVPASKDSMKSTWRDADRSQWGPFHWFYELLRIHPTHENEAPVHKKTDKVPYMSDYYLHRWVILHAFMPLAIHHVLTLYLGRNLSGIEAFFLYSASFKITAIRELHILRNTGREVGFLDGDAHPRDGVPDSGVGKVMFSLISTSTVRPIFSVFLAYTASQTPAQMNWFWLPIEAGLYGIVLDFWFYWYHRLMHEVEWLWKFHRTHHLTKHPNPLLTLYADSEQEFWDMVGIPLLTYFSMKLMGFPMGFYEWWVGHQYVVFAELAGHSGLRLMATPPNVFSFALRWFNAELIIEDHDMHHRKGWKASGNYGKQTRFWDRAFGTCKDRVECLEDKIDWDRPIKMPLF